MKRSFLPFLLALLLLFSLGCGKKEAPASQQGTESPDQGDVTSQSPKPELEGGKTSEPASGTESSTPDETLDPDPHFDGVYENENGILVIRHAEEGACDIIVSAGDDGADGYLAGIAQILDNTVIYETEAYALSAVVSFDDLTVTEEGRNPYSQRGFAGTYHRTGADPLEVQVRRSSAAQELPETFSHTAVNGESAILYIDPQNRFTVTIPDVFSTETAYGASGEILLKSIDGDVFASIGFEDIDGGETPEALKTRLEDRTGATADVFVDGTVALEYAETGAEGESLVVVCVACPLKNGTAIVIFRYLASQDEYFRPLVDLISINAN